MSNREVLIGVSGGIAAYKTAALVSQLVQSGVNITVVMTASAEKFVGRATFAALSGRSVATDIFDESEYPLGAHIMLAQRAQLLCVAPATANFLAKAATGMSDDLLSTLYLCFRGPVLMAPAMNSEMWEKPAVQRNIKQLREDGVEFLEPEEGWLSCRQTGTGRMVAPERVFSAIHERFVQLRSSTI
jgi:phosphopantothenoylcysteine decarboxylase